METQDISLDFAANSRAEELLNEDELYLGAGANVQFQAARFGSIVGKITGNEELENNPSIAATEKFIKNRAEAVLRIMASGALGSGTGLSDADRDFASQTVGQITQNKETLREFLRIERAALVWQAENHNKKLKFLTDTLRSKGKNADADRYSTIYTIPIPTSPVVGSSSKTDAYKEEAKNRVNQINQQGQP